VLAEASRTVDTRADPASSFACASASSSASSSSSGSKSSSSTNAAAAAGGSGGASSLLVSAAAVHESAGLLKSMQLWLGVSLAWKPRVVKQRLTLIQVVVAVAVLKYACQYKLAV
jgi:hypothetical protein